MGLEAVDCFYVHRRDPATPIEDVTEILAGFIKAGKIKGFGFSEIAPSSLRRAHSVHPVMAVQSEYSLSVRSPELGLVQTCAELGTAFVAFSPVARSLLTDKPHDLEKLKSIPFLVNNPRFMEPNLSANVALTEPFRPCKRLWSDSGWPCHCVVVASIRSYHPHPWHTLCLSSK